ncbi:MAG: hypothetical protein H7837_08945 [Magnetococcus sp. MYC-9]
MNDGRITASRDIVEIVTHDNFNLVWATIDWAIHAERFRLTTEAVLAFRKIPHESQTNDAVLPLLDDWMERFLRPETRRRIFAEIRRAQFEAAKGAVQITISEETHSLLRSRKKALFGPNRGSMEVTIRHLLETEQRALPWQAFRLLEAFRQRHALPGLSDAVRVLIDYAELGYQSQERGDPEGEVEARQAPLATTQPVPATVPPVPETQPPLAAPAKPTERPTPSNHPTTQVWDALIRCWTI